MPHYMDIVAIGIMIADSQKTILDTDDKQILFRYHNCFKDIALKY
jgi:hypothetical protein